MGFLSAFGLGAFLVFTVFFTPRSALTLASPALFFLAADLADGMVEVEVEVEEEVEVEVEHLRKYLRSILSARKPLPNMKKA